MNILRHNDRLLLLQGFVPVAECERLIAWSEQEGFEEAKINVGQGPQKIQKDVRNNDRLFWDNPDLAATWFALAREAFPVPGGPWQPYSLNERFRFYRYHPGQRFARHRDGSYERSANEMSFYTFMVYLNDGYEGGRTRFEFRGEPPLEVHASPGDALLFHHDVLHEGQEVRSGTKYVLRTDVMYRR